MAELSSAFLAPGAYVDSDDADIVATARALAAGAASEQELVRRCFEFVRDAVSHSVDARANPVTCRASDVLRHKTGFCYAKSHLLAALLRANGVPAGLCYQRLSMGDGSFCLHGLNAVYLTGAGWYRVDPRGNKPGMDAQFCPPRERLAFAVGEPGECDFPGIYGEPLPLVTAALERCSTFEEVLANLPDAPSLEGPYLAALRESNR